MGIRGRRFVNRAGVKSEYVRVPNFVGLSAGAARERARLDGFEVVGLPSPEDAPSSNSEAALIAGQVPQEGTYLQPGGVVRLWFDGGSGYAGVREPRRPLPRK